MRYAVRATNRKNGNRVTGTRSFRSKMSASKALSRANDKGFNKQYSNPRIVKLRKIL